MANFKILYSTHTHTPLSLIINILSIFSFFVIYGMESTLSFVPQLYGSFIYLVRIPMFHFLIIFFIFLLFVTEIVMFWAGFYYKQKKELKKIEEEKKLRMQRKIFELQPIKASKKHMGFAFDAEVGHAP